MNAKLSFNCFFNLRFSCSFVYFKSINILFSVSFKINRKERVLALKTALTYKLQEKELFVIDNMAMTSLKTPKAIPPPRHNGERFDPALARPVPFCFQGFLPPPETSLLFLVFARRSQRCYRNCRRKY